MNIREAFEWARRRSPAYVVRRAAALVARYGLGSGRSKRRAADCVDRLARHGCRPSFMVPGRVVERHGRFLRELERRGAELAIHGYDHVDFRTLTADQAHRQLSRAADAFRRRGIAFEGFRCPYLGFAEHVAPAAAAVGIRYGSNRAVWWAEETGAPGRGASTFDQLLGFYQPQPAARVLSVPRHEGPLLEIPPSLPDDMLLFDGLGLSQADAARAWCRVLDAVHRRGELFVLVFHPELFDRCAAPFDALLERARTLAPPIWLATLRDVSRWWHEREGFSSRVETRGTALRIELSCSERATVVVRGSELDAPTEAWHDGYRLVTARSFTTPARPRPLLGIAPGVPARVRRFLAEQGYLLEDGAAEDCGLRVDADLVSRLGSDVALLERIEASPAPLVRIWRWPNGARGALAVTGDLDALSLADYAARLTGR